MQRVDNLCHGRILLTDRDIDTDHALVLLVENRIECDGGLAGLAVTDDQLSLAAPDGEHRIDGQNTGLHGHRDGLALHDRGGRALHGIVVVRLDLAAPVDRLSERIDHTSEEILAHRDTGPHFHTSGAASDADLTVGAEEDDTDGILLDILDHAFDPALKEDDLPVLCVAEPLDMRDAVADIGDMSDAPLLRGQLKLADGRVDNGDDVLVLRDRVSDLVELPAQRRNPALGTPVVDLVADLKDEASAEGSVLLGSKKDILPAVILIHIFFIDKLTDALQLLLCGRRNIEQGSRQCFSLLAQLFPPAKKWLRKPVTSGFSMPAPHRAPPLPSPGSGQRAQGHSPHCHCRSPAWPCPPPPDW